MRVHDLRGTFVTISLAIGKSEAWVASRTGHGSSVMINAYRRTAQSCEEIGGGELAPLDLAARCHSRPTLAGRVGLDIKKRG
jgi:hypothetical protein